LTPRVGCTRAVARSSRAIKSWGSTSVHLSYLLSHQGKHGIATRGMRKQSVHPYEVWTGLPCRGALDLQWFARKGFWALLHIWMWQQRVQPQGTSQRQCRKCVGKCSQVFWKKHYNCKPVQRGRSNRGGGVHTPKLQSLWWWWKQIQRLLLLRQWLSAEGLP